MLKAGFAKQEITPTGPVPLAGYFGLRDRLSEKVRDPLFVRALALEENGKMVVLLVYDLLLINEPLVQEVRARLYDLDLNIILAATHTHSGPGGYWNTFVAKLALGKYRPGMLQVFAEAGVTAVREAVADMSHARWTSHEDRLPQLAKNRRDSAGPVDDKLWVMRFARQVKNKGDLLLCGFPGHPVIVAERDNRAVSADFPGEVVQRLEGENSVDGAIFINGALGGVDVLFPEEDISADHNLDLQASPISEAARPILKKRLRTKTGLTFASREVILDRKPDSQPLFDDRPGWATALKPVTGIVNYSFSQSQIARWRVQGFSIGDSCIIGTPADLGVSISLAIQEYAMLQGFKTPFVASQCDGYIGYLHRRDDYRITPDKSTRGMAIYENLMGIFGRDMGENLLETARSLVDELAATHSQ